MPLLKSKFTRPAVTAGFIDRPRLYQQLDQWRGYRAVAIHAPAGYGKSSLVSRWIEESDLAPQAAWLSLDQGEADAQRFVHYLAASLDGVVAGTLSLIQPILEDSRGDASRALLRLLSALQDGLVSPAERDEPVLLVLDDLQRAQSPGVAELLLMMLEQGPDMLHLLLLARHQTDLPLARLLAHEQLLVLDREDLRFTEAEVCQLLVRRGLASPSAADVTELTTRSEGWVTALQLALLSLRQDKRVQDLLDVLRGDADWLANFLTDEVLKQQPPARQHFLVQTSVLDEFCASLCVAVTGDATAYAHLAAIDRTDLFLIHLDQANEWMRYHHLFKELLYHRLLAHAEPEDVAALHHRAAVWLAEAGRSFEAVRHLLAAGAEEAAATLVEARLRPALMTSPHDAQRLLALLPEAVQRQRPRLLLERCYLALCFDDRSLNGLVQHLESYLAAEPQSLADHPGLQGELLVLKSAVSHLKGDLAAAKRRLDATAAYADALSPHFAGTRDFIQMHVEHYGGNHRAAERFGHQALGAFQAAGFSLGLVAVRREMARWSMRLGKSQEAAARFETLFGTWHRGQFVLTRDIMLAYFFAAENSYWQNQLDQAHVYQQACLTLATELQDAELMEAARLLEQSLLATEQRNGIAIDEAWQGSLESSSSSSVQEFILFLQTRILIAQGRRSEAWRRLEQNEGEHGQHWPNHVRLAHLIFLYAYVGRGARLEAITQELAHALTHVEQSGNRLYQLHLLILTAWQQLQLFGIDSATETLARAVRLALETGYVRLLLDVPELAMLLPDLPEWRTSGVGDLPRRAEGDPGLTGQERHVLELLATERTYQQIADELVVSINTVRTHIRHIYRKLEVNQRDRAVAIGRARRLLAAPQEEPVAKR